ncbi:MAG: adenosylcobinamide-GDP ribazoletransferase [Proteobacteria bacterium]|nr:adenosylcobinamide-GDP ribazoletransferase [Pseudomonadota bacterium]HQR04134.1 adenosylcobinamide-GDP ribazoletransferase [Rhodocyclaceae bacterium]
MKELESFFAALRFFTRLPVPAWVGHSQDQLDRAARYFPWVGVLIGTIGAGVTEAAAWVLPVSIAVLLGMVATLLATGAFHEDGLADSIDGFGGGWDRTQVLAIMKDSRIGSYGAIGIGLTLLAKFQALLEIDAAHAPPFLVFALIAGHALSRLAATTLIHALEYVREDALSKSKPLAVRLSWPGLAVAAVGGLLPCLTLGSAVLPAIGLATLTTMGLARYFRRRLGGYTGDCLGATQQLSELAFYLGLLWSFT